MGQSMDNGARVVIVNSNLGSALRPTVMFSRFADNRQARLPAPKQTALPASYLFFPDWWQLSRRPTESTFMRPDCDKEDKQ